MIILREGLTPLKLPQIKEVSPCPRAAFRGIREASFFLNTPSCGYLVKGLKGTCVPFRNYLPLPLDKGKGIQGIGLIHNL